MVAGSIEVKRLSMPRQFAMTFSDTILTTLVVVVSMVPAIGQGVHALPQPQIQHASPPIPDQLRPQPPLPSLSQQQPQQGLSTEPPFAGIATDNVATVGSSDLSVVATGMQTKFLANLRESASGTNLLSNFARAFEQHWKRGDSDAPQTQNQGAAFTESPPTAAWVARAQNDGDATESKIEIGQGGDGGVLNAAATSIDASASRSDSPTRAALSQSQIPTQNMVTVSVADPNDPNVRALLASDQAWSCSSWYMDTAFSYLIGLFAAYGAAFDSYFSDRAAPDSDEMDAMMSLYEVLAASATQLKAAGGSAEEEFDPSSVAAQHVKNAWWLPYSLRRSLAPLFDKTYRVRVARDEPEGGEVLSFQRFYRGVRSVPGLGKNIKENLVAPCYSSYGGTLCPPNDPPMRQCFMMHYRLRQLGRLNNPESAKHANSISAQEWLTVWEKSDVEKKKNKLLDMLKDRVFQSVGLETFLDKRAFCGKLFLEINLLDSEIYSRISEQNMDKIDRLFLNVDIAKQAIKLDRREEAFQDLLDSLWDNL